MPNIKVVDMTGKEVGTMALSDVPIYVTDPGVFSLLKASTSPSF